MLGFAVKTLEGVEIRDQYISEGAKLKLATAGQVRLYNFSFSLCISPSDYFLILEWPRSMEREVALCLTYGVP